MLAPSRACVRNLTHGHTPGRAPGSEGSTMRTANTTCRTAVALQRRTAVALLAAVGALAGCGSSGGGDEGGAPTTTISPLADLMGWSNDSPTESRRKQLQVEELVADCMREEGWEYTPVDWSATDPSSGTADAELQATDPQAFGEKHGYGVAYFYEIYEAPGLEGGTDEGGPIGPVGPVNPNDEYVQSLSQSEQEEYYASLYGKPVEGMASDDPVGTAVAVTVAPEDQGCYGLASAEVYPVNETANDPDIQQRMQEYWEDQQQAPELVAAYERWATCISEDEPLVDQFGDPIESPNDVYSYVDALKYEALGLVAEQVTQEELDSGIGDYYTAMTDEEGNGVAWRGTPEPMDDATLEELRATEVELWGRDRACQEDARIAEIQMELEQRFVDDLVAEFPELAGES